MLQRISDGYVLLDRECRFLDANPAAERDMKNTLAEIRGRVHSRERFRARAIANPPG